MQTLGGKGYVRISSRTAQLRVSTRRRQDGSV